MTADETDSRSARNWKFGAYEPLNPEDTKSLGELFFLGSRCKNEYVEIEHERRDLIEQQLRALSTAYSANRVTRDVLEAQITDAYAEKRKFNSSQRKRSEHPELDAKIKSLKAQRVALDAAAKPLRSPIFKTDEWKTFEQTLDGEKETRWRPDGTVSPRGIRNGGVIREKKLRIYANYRTLGMNTTTIDQIYKDIVQARKTGRAARFAPFDGGGRIIVQILKTTVNKRTAYVPWTSIVNGTAKVATVTRVPQGIYRPGKAHPKKLGNAILRLSLGRGRAVEIPFTLHREPPLGSTVQFISIHRHRVGTRSKWAVMFTFAHTDKAVWRDPLLAKTGAVAIDLGWRMQPDGGIKVATWVGDDGATGTVELPTNAKPARAKFDLTWRERMEKTYAIESGRDTDYDKVRDQLIEFLRARGSIPDFIKDMVKKDTTDAKILLIIKQWRAQKRLVKVVFAWRTNRFDGDAEIFQAVESWRHHDKHLLNYEDGLREKLLRNRLDIYRVAAATLTRRYATVVLEGKSQTKKKQASIEEQTDQQDEPAESDLMDLRDFHEDPGPEAKPGAVGQRGTRAKVNVRHAALSTLRASFVNRASSIVSVPAAGSSKKCSACGKNTDPGASETYECRFCGLTIDRDVNAAKNLLQKHLTKAQVTSVA